MFSLQLLLPVVLSDLDLLIVLPDAYNISKLHIGLPSLSLSLLFTTASFMFFSYLLLLYALNTVFTVGLEKGLSFFLFSLVFLVSFFIFLLVAFFGSICDN